MAKRKKVQAAVEKSTDQGMLLLQPYLAMGLVGVISIVLWVLSEKGYKLHIELALAASTIGLSWFTWKASRSRRDFGRLHAVLTMASAGGWIMAMVGQGPENPTLWIIWLLGGLTIGISWNIRQAIKSESRDDAMRMFFEEMGLPGTKLTIRDKTVDKIKGTVQMRRGSHSIDSLQKKRSNLASLFGAPLTGVRIRQDPDDAAKGFLTVVRKDMLRQVTPYEYTPGTRTANEPFAIGVYEDGDPAQYSLHDARLGAAHMLIQGMNGSGKSEAAKVIFAEAFKCQELDLWIVDITKGSQTLNMVSDAADWIISEEIVADRLFKRFPSIIKKRADFLGSKRLTKWEPGCGLSFIYLHIEEASGLIANNPAFIKMMETARSVGITIASSLQRASHNSIDTSSRAQFSAVLCFGVTDHMDAQFALPDDVLAAGATPESWRNSKPGYAYLVHPTVDDDRWTTPLRTFKIEDSELEKAAAARLPNELDRVTLLALGDLYQAELDDDPSNDEEEIEEYYDDEDREEDEEAMRELESKYGDAFLEFDKVPEMAPQAAYSELVDKLNEMRENGIQDGLPFVEFLAPAMGEVLAITGRSRGWMHKQLEKKVKEGYLEKEDFTYRFVDMRREVE